MKFTPSNPGDNSPVVPEGTYLMTAVSAAEKVSKRGESR